MRRGLFRGPLQLQPQETRENVPFGRKRQTGTLKQLDTPCPVVAISRIAMELETSEGTPPSALVCLVSDLGLELARARGIVTTRRPRRLRCVFRSHELGVASGLGFTLVPGVICHVTAN